MLRACDDAQHPFWYARVIGIYHANVFFGHNSGCRLEQVDLLYVRWFGRDPDWKGGPATLRLDRIGWVPEDDPSGAFGFVNPSRVVRACHLIPAFALGKTTRLLRVSQTWDTLSGDWINYYVSRSVPSPFEYLIVLIHRRFVDRDMMMRHLGWGIGHCNPPEFSHEADSLIASSSDRELAQFGDPPGKYHTEIDKGVESDAAGEEGDSDLDVISGGEEDCDADVVAPLGETFDY